MSIGNNCLLCLPFQSIEQTECVSVCWLGTTNCKSCRHNLYLIKKADRDWSGNKPAQVTGLVRRTRNRKSNDPTKHYEGTFCWMCLSYRKELSRKRQYMFTMWICLLIVIKQWWICVHLRKKKKLFKTTGTLVCVFCWTQTIKYIAIFRKYCHSVLNTFDVYT